MIPKAGGSAAGLAGWVVGIAFAAAASVLFLSVVQALRDRRPMGAQGAANADRVEVYQERRPLEVPLDVRLLENVLSATDAVFHDGDWFVLDARAAQVHRLDSAGTLLSSFGRRGRGPGELGALPAAITVHGDSIVVTERTSNQVHLYSPRRRCAGHPSGSSRRMPFARIHDLASSALGLLLLVRCRNDGIRTETRVVLEAEDGFNRTVAARLPQPDGPVVLDALTPPILSLHPEGFVFGSAQDTCLGVYRLDGEAIESVCHDWLALVATPRELIRRMRSTLSARTDIRWTLPEQFYPIAEVFVTRNGRWIYRVLASDQPESYELIAPGRQDSIRLPVPRATYAFVNERTALLGWDDLEGVRFTTYCDGGSLTWVATQAGYRR